MSEPAGLPRHPYPVLLPEAGGFEEAMGRARARRRRQALEATAALSVVALFAGGALLARPSLDGEAGLGFTQEPDGQNGRTGGGNVPAGTPSAGPSASSTAPVGGGNQVPVRPDGRQPADPGPSVRPSVPDVRPSAEPLGKATKYQVVRGAETYNTTCPTETSSDWCLYATYEGQGNLYTLRAVVCRLGSNPLGSGLTFPGDQEVDYQIRLRDEVMWTWSAGQTFESGKRTHPALKPGECVKWETRWDAEDEYGRLVPYSNQPGVGKYELVVRTTAEELGGRTASTEFNVGD